MNIKFPLKERVEQLCDEASEYWGMSDFSEYSRELCKSKQDDIEKLRKILLTMLEEHEQMTRSFQRW